MEHSETSIPISAVQSKTCMLNVWIIDSRSASPKFKLLFKDSDGNIDLEMSECITTFSDNQSAMAIDQEIPSQLTESSSESGYHHSQEDYYDHILDIQSSQSDSVDIGDVSFSHVFNLIEWRYKRR